MKLSAKVLWAAVAALTVSPIEAAPRTSRPKTVAVRKVAAEKVAVRKVDTRSSDRPNIDIVFCIDCSGSMGDVIETAKQKVWSIVNEVAKAKPSPVLRIGLFGYGNADRDFRKFELSDDLDEVYKNLMTFRDEGWGEEYVGMQVHKATTEMAWDKGSSSLRVIYMVGNETARQGPPPMDYTKTTPQAVKRDIWVNAIYCGESGGEETWREMARLGEGKYLHIAANGGGITVATPFDKKLELLNVALNKTYLAFGARGEVSRRNQVAQDANAAGVGGAPTLAARSMAKASAQYNNRGWDLVDASREKGFDLKKLKKEELPAPMQKMTLAQQKAFIAKNAAARGTLQLQIRNIGLQREAYIEKEIKKSGLNESQSLDLAIRRSVVEQAKKRGFKFR